VVVRLLVVLLFGSGSYVPQWSKSDLENRIEAATEAAKYLQKNDQIPQEIILKIRSGWYPCLVDNLFKSLQDFPMIGKTVLVANPAEPWTEAVLLAHGASSVTFTDSRPTHDLTGNPKLNFVHTLNLTGSYDAIFKFDDDISALMHIGLGRYGDTIDPEADFKRMNGFKNYLKNDGLFFFSAPIGPDTIEFNAHRIYGPARFSRLKEGYTVKKYYPCFLDYPTLEEAFSTKLKSKWENQWITVMGKDVGNCRNFTMSHVLIFLGMIIGIGYYCSNKFCS